jgi:hypothetical protein
LAFPIGFGQIAVRGARGEAIGQHESSVAEEVWGAGDRRGVQGLLEGILDASAPLLGSLAVSPRGADRSLGEGCGDGIGIPTRGKADGASSVRRMGEIPRKKRKEMMMGRDDAGCLEDGRWWCVEALLKGLGRRWIHVPKERVSGVLKKAFPVWVVVGVEKDMRGEDLVAEGLLLCDRWPRGRSFGGGAELGLEGDSSFADVVEEGTEGREGPGSPGARGPGRGRFREMAIADGLPPIGQDAAPASDMPSGREGGGVEAENGTEGASGLDERLSDLVFAFLREQAAPDLVGDAVQGSVKEALLLKQGLVRGVGDDQEAAGHVAPGRARTLSSQAMRRAMASICCRSWTMVSRACGQGR